MSSQGGCRVFLLGGQRCILSKELQSKDKGAKAWELQLEAEMSRMQH